MRYVLLVLIIGLAALSSDLGTSERAQLDSQLQPVIFAAAFGSH